MQIRTRLTLLFTALVALLLVSFAVAIYVITSRTREDEYFKKLHQQAATKANLLLDAKVAPDVLQLIYKDGPNSLFEEEVAIYDTSFHLLYHDAVDIDKVKETRDMIDSIIQQRTILFYLGDLQVVGFLYEHKGQQYVITAAAKDEYGLMKLASLRNTMLLALLISVVIIFLVGLFLARKSLGPVSTLLNRVKEITATNLDLRLAEGNRKDEIAALAMTFNEVLDRLENSFDAQKQFVSNISHELRTPLTAMLAELQLTISKERTTDEYKRSVRHAIADTRKLIRLINDLLDFAKANYDHSEIARKAVRIDELLLDARAEVMHHQSDYNIDIRFELESDNDNDLSVFGNEYLLKVAFINLMENGCKFSMNKRSYVRLDYNKRNIMIYFSDEGIGIAEPELEQIFMPFFRGSNKQFAGGNGIGLSLTKKVIELHTGTITVDSIQERGTTFQVILPHL